MILSKPKFWAKKNSLISFLFLPLTFLIIFFIYLKKIFTKTIKFNCPVICIGNIYLGGTGKTPLSILLGNELKKMGKNPALVRKYYKTHSDEHRLIKKKFNALILNKDRSFGITEAMKNNFDSVILDDGFQDYKIRKDLNIICFNQNQLIGNGFVFPSGPLREKLTALKSAQIIFINGEKNIDFERKILNVNKNLEFFYAKYKPINLDEFQGKQLFALAGIGNPDNFFEILLKNNLQIKKKLIFPDHYQFTKNEMLNIVKDAKNNNAQIIMTEKDYYKIIDFNLQELKYLKVSLEIREKIKLLEILTELYDKKN